VSLSVDDFIRDRILACDDGFVLAVEAEKAVAELREKHGPTLRHWLDENAARFVTERMGEHLRSERAKTVRRRNPRAFAGAEAAFQAGDAHAFDDVLDVSYCVNGEKEWKPFRSMTRDDCEYVAVDYEKDAAASAMEAALMRQVAKKLRNGQTVGDVFTAEQVARMRQAA